MNQCYGRIRKGIEQDEEDEMAPVQEKSEYRALLKQRFSTLEKEM